MSKTYIRHFKDNFKLDLAYNGLINSNEIFEIINDEEICNNNDKEKEEQKQFNPLFDLIENYDYLIQILKSQDLNVIEYIYLNKYKIHKILYDKDSTIHVELDFMSEFPDYYYLYYLIMEQKELTNYNYDFQIIKNAYDMHTNSDFDIKKIILAKITIALINNYDNETDENEEDCQKMKDICEKSINECKNSLLEFSKDLDFESLVSSDVYITEIYTDILKYLIINKKLDDSEETVDLLNALELKKLRINKPIFEALKEVLIKENLEDFKLEKYEDFSNDKKLTFYYMLFEYILKSRDYIFHIPFLLETRDNIIQIIKKNLVEFSSELKKGKNKSPSHKLKVVLDHFIEYDYYYQKGLGAKKHKKEEIKPSRESKDSNSHSNARESQNSNLSNNNINNNTDSSVFNSSESSNKSSSSQSPFENSDFQKRSNPNSFFNYDISGQREIDKSKDIAYLILTDSVFTILVKKIDQKGEANVDYKSIIYKFREDNIEQEKAITITEIRNYEPEGDELKTPFNKFKDYLTKIETELKERYTSEKEKEIVMKIKMKNHIGYIINCDFSVNNEKYTDEDFLDKGEHQGLSCMVNQLEEE